MECRLEFQIIEVSSNEWLKLGVVFFVPVIYYTCNLFRVCFVYRSLAPAIFIALNLQISFTLHPSTEEN